MLITTNPNDSLFYSRFPRSKSVPSQEAAALYCAVALRQT